VLAGDPLSNLRAIAELAAAAGERQQQQGQGQAAALFGCDVLHFGPNYSDQDRRRVLLDLSARFDLSGLRVVVENQFSIQTGVPAPPPPLPGPVLPLLSYSWLSRSSPFLIEDYNG
jgi:hypothetical protein